MPDKFKKLFGWLGFGSDVLGSVANVVSTALTNKSNQRIEAARNAMQIAENEKAYQRSKPTNQVANLQAAGMSKAGALSTLNGGGSYTPATISSSTNQAPQVDLSSAFDGLIQIGENAKQRKLQEDLLDKQITAAKEQQAAQIESDEKKHTAQLESNERIADANRTSNENIANERLEFDKSVHNFFKDNQNKLLLKQIQKLEDDHKLSKQQYEHFETIKPFLVQSAEKQVEKLVEDIKTAKFTRDNEYRKYLIEKIKTKITYEFGAPISYLRESIDFWKNPDVLDIVGGRSVGWKTDDTRLLWQKESSFREYMEQLSTILDEIDRISVE